jgi:hypothetical protein
MNAQQTVEKAMRENPVGIVVSLGPKTCSAVFWTDRPTEPAVMAGNFISGFAQQAIDRGVWTKQQALLALETVLNDRV